MRINLLKPVDQRCVVNGMQLTALAMLPIGPMRRTKPGTPQGWLSQETSALFLSLKPAL